MRPAGRLARKWARGGEMDNDHADVCPQQESPARRAPDTGDRQREDPADPVAAEWSRRLKEEVSRRRFLYLCGAATAVSMGTVVASCSNFNGTTTSAVTAGGAPVGGATTSSAAATSSSASTSAPASSPASASPAAAPPSARSTAAQKLAPFDDDAVELNEGLAAEFSSGTANKSNGLLEANVDFECEGDGSLKAAVVTYVRWNFTYQGPADVRATVAVNYSFSPGEVDTFCKDPISGYGQSWVRVGAYVTDVSSGDEVDLPIEEHGSGQLLLPVQMAESYKGQQTPITFKPGHSYFIDGYLVAGGYIYKEGWVKASGSAIINGLSLVTMEPPWIRTRVVSVSAPDNDTYLMFENAMERTGRHYYLGAAMLEISAGGGYGWGSAQVTTQGSKSKIVGFLNCFLSTTIDAANPNVATILLPAAAELPLEGKTWRFMVAYDPHFQQPWDNLVLDLPDVPVMPLFVPIVGMWLDMDAAMPELKATASLRPSAVLASYSVAAASPQVVATDSFFNLDNFSLILPLSRFQALSQPANAKLPPGTRALPVGIYRAPTAKAVTFNTGGLGVTNVPSLPAGVQRAEFTTEPVVIVSLLDLWNQFLDMEHLITQATGLEWCANPRFIRFLQQVGENAEAHRAYLNGLYWLPRTGGPAIRLVDLPEAAADRLGNPNGAYPLWVTVAGATVAVVVLLHPRLRRWVRRAMTLSAIRDYIANHRPVQDQLITLRGEVSGTQGEMTANAQAQQKVFFDVVPQRYNSNGTAPDLA
jgi:hypothetical protein